MTAVDARIPADQRMPSGRIGPPSRPDPDSLQVENVEALVCERKALRAGVARSVYFLIPLGIELYSKVEISPSDKDVPIHVEEALSLLLGVGSKFDKYGPPFGKRQVWAGCGIESQ